MSWIPVPRPLCHLLVGATFLSPLMAQSDDWTRLPPNSGQPSHRFNHTLAYDSLRNVLVLLGGKNANSNQHSFRTWTWNGALWTESVGTHPPARANHAMAFHAASGRMVMFGGDDLAQVYRDTWTWDGANWNQEIPTLTLPRRTRGAMAYDAQRQQVVMFGGHDANPANLAGTWLWNGTDWTQASPSTPPQPRRHLSIVQDSATGRILLFGGTTNQGQSGTYTNYNDTWEWNGSNWNMVNGGTAGSPSPRFRVAMAFDGRRQRITLQGGRTGPYSYVDDTWQWDWQTLSWSLLPTLQSPSLRTGAAMAFDTSRQRLILFGGQRDFTSNPRDEQAYDDTWEFGIPAGAAAFPLGSGCATGAPALQLTATALPQRGTTPNLQLDFVQPNELPFLVAGFSDQYLVDPFWGTVRLPSPLPNLGSCEFQVAPVVSDFMPAQGSTATRQWPIPNIPSLRGTTVFLQCVNLHPASGTIRTSNGLGLRLD